MAQQSCYLGIVENKHSKEDFIRKSYIELYSAIDAPESVNDVEFSDVFSETAQLIQQYTTYDIDYTVEIGYDHEEQYIDQEKYYNSDLKKYLTREVVKNRTVTVWQPHQGSAENLRGITVGVFNTGDNIDIGDKDEKNKKQYEDYAFDVEEVLKNKVNREATEEEAKKMCVPTEQDYLHFARTSASNSNFYNMVQLPGDRQRGFNAKWEATDMFACVFAVERYKLAFDYEGQKCFIKQFATEDVPNIYCSYKYVDSVDEDIKKAEKEKLHTNPEFQRNAKIYKWGTYGSLGLGILSLALSQFISLLGVLGIALAVIGFIISYQFGKKMKAQGEAIQQEYKNKRNEHKTEMQRKKMELLERRFASMGFAPLTDEEKERFLPKNQHKLTDLFYDSSEYDEEDLEEPEEPEESEQEQESAWED